MRGQSARLAMPAVRWTWLAIALPVLGCAGTPAPAHAPAAASTRGAGSDTPAAAAPAQAPLGSVYGPDTTTIEARPGERFSLALPRDPTGSWTVDPELDQSVARVVQERTQGDTHYVLFDAVGIGPTDLRVRLRGADSPAPGPPTREVTVRVRVEAGAP